jgi:hypothetical protein
MKKLAFSMLLLAIALMLGGTAVAQETWYFTTYYSANQANAPDATLRIINDGYGLAVASPALYASIYVFDDSEELTECCSCYVSPDGLLSESVKQNLTANPLRGTVNTRGVIKVIGSLRYAGGLNFTNFPSPGLHVWMTHIEGTKVTLSPGNGVVPGVSGPFFVTETPAAISNLVFFGQEETLLENLCMYDFLLSGKGCSCQPEDNDF